MALRGRGDTKTPLRIGVVVNIANVLLGYGLIYGFMGLPAMGLVGSALGTTIARSIGAFMLLLHLLRSTHPVRLDFPALFRLDFAMGRVLRIGVAAHQVAGWGLAAAWTSLAFGWTFRMVFAYLRIRSGRWRQVSL